MESKLAVDPTNGVVLPIAAVERDTGLSKDTLRVWERRYGFPMPLRDAQGGRNYPTAQVERLRMLKRLLDAGHRPGKLMLLTPADLQRLAGSSVLVLENVAAVVERTEGVTASYGGPMPGVYCEPPSYEVD